MTDAPGLTRAKLRTTASKTNSTKLTSFTENELPSFNAQDLCFIIKTCHECGVHELKIGGLRVVFGAPKPETPTPLAQPPEPVSSDPVDQKREFERQELEVKKDQLAVMMITDPKAYEDLVAANDLLNSSEAEEEFDGDTKED